MCVILAFETTHIVAHRMLHLKPHQSPGIFTISLVWTVRLEVMQYVFTLQAETRVILNERILLDEAQARAAQAETRQGEGDINTDDDDDDTVEYEQWHHREMARIARCDADTLQCLLSTWHLRVPLCCTPLCSALSHQQLILSACGWPS